MSGFVDEFIRTTEQVFAEGRSLVCPSIGEYSFYNDLAYELRCSARMRAYESVVNKSVAGKSVVEIGTGEQAHLALMCAKAGAEKVYAIEINPKFAMKAAEYVAKSGYSEIITIITGDAMKVEIPEKVDLCVSEIIGTIGGSEGAVSILKNAKRFLKSDGKMIPFKCLTMIAPVTESRNVYKDDFIDEIIDGFVAQIYRSTQKTFPLTRFIHYNFPEENILAKAGIFEEDEFEGDLNTVRQGVLKFKIDRTARFDGFLLWTQLYVDEETVINSLKDSFWGPVFLKNESFDVTSGDEIVAICERQESLNQINPDYFINGSVLRCRKVSHSFTINSYHSR